jgi:hypothetical protein
MVDIFYKLDKLLEGDPRETAEDIKQEKMTGKEEVRLDEITSELSHIGFEIGGEVKNSEGDVVAKAHAGDPDPGSFELNIRLVVPASMWHRVEVICEGNALDVDTSPMSDGRYKVRKRVNGYKPAILDEEYVIELRKFNSTKEFMAWIETLDTDDIRALLQIYYDKWNFDSGDEKDRMYYALLEEELQGRKK